MRTIQKQWAVRGKSQGDIGRLWVKNGPRTTTELGPFTSS